MFELIGSIIGFAAEMVGFALELVFGVVEVVFSLIGGVLEFVFGIIGGVFSLITSLWFIVLVAVIAAAIIRHFRRKAPQDNGTIELDGETFVSYYHQEQES